MANTEQIEAKLCAYVDGELDEAGRAEIEQHLLANPQHRQLLAELREQRLLVQALPRAKAPDEIYDAMQSQLERSVLLAPDDEQAHTTTMRINRWPQMFAAAAVLLLTVGLAAVIYFVLPRSGQHPDVALSTAATLPTGEGEVAADRSSTPAEPSVALAPAPAVIPEVAMKDRDASEKKGADLTVNGGNFYKTGAGALTRNDFNRKESSGIANHLFDAEAIDQIKTAGNLSSNTAVVVVAAKDLTQANADVTRYLAGNGYTWQAVPENLPTLSQQNTQGISGSKLQSPQVAMEEKSLATVAPPAAPPPARHYAGKGDGPGEQEQVADKSKVGQQRQAAPDAVPAAPPPVTAAPAPPAEASQPADVSQQRITQATTAPAGTAMANASYDSRNQRLIIARGLTRRQVSDLTSNFSMPTYQNAGQQQAAEPSSQPVGQELQVGERAKPEELAKSDAISGLRRDPEPRKQLELKSEAAQEIAPPTTQTVAGALATTQPVAAPAEQIAQSELPTADGLPSQPASGPATQSVEGQQGAPSTQPGEERLDVVIVVTAEDQTPAALNTAPTTDESASQPTTSPTQ